MMFLPCSYPNPCSCNTQILRLCHLLSILTSVSLLPPLMSFYFLKIQVSVLHLLVNLSDCNIRIKNLTDKLVSPFFLVPHLNLFLHASFPATVSHDHMLNRIISIAWTTQIVHSVHLPSLQLSHSTFTANILQTYLVIQPTTFLVFSSLTGSFIIITQSLSANILNSLLSLFLCHIFWQILPESEYPPYNIHTISEYRRPHPSRWTLWGGVRQG